MQPEGYEYREETLNGQPIGVTTFSVRGRFFCHIDNVNPGATIARGHADNRQEAETIAYEKARNALARYSR